MVAQGAMPACPACGSGQPTFLRQARAADSALRSCSFPLARCSSCGTAVVEATLPDRAALHAARREGGEPPGLRWAVAVLRRIRAWERLRPLRGLPRGAVVLDVGAGDGSFLRALQQAGYRAVGVEPYGAPADLSAPAGLLRVPVEELSLPPGSVDAAVCWHVLEHLADPAVALRRLRLFLRPGGLLVAAVPNRESLQALLGGDRWFQQDVPRHLVHFTPRGLRRLLQRCGFEGTRIRQPVSEQGVVAMWQTLLNLASGEQEVAYRLLGRRQGRPPGRRAVAAAALAGPLLAPAALMLELAAAAAGRAGSMVAVARRGR